MTTEIVVFRRCTYGQLAVHHLGDGSGHAKLSAKYVRDDHTYLDLRNWQRRHHERLCRLPLWARNEHAVAVMRWRTGQWP
jgi:hypothetical protein